MSTLMDKYNFNSDRFEYVQPNEESYPSNTSYHQFNSTNSNNPNYDHVAIARNDNINNNQYNTFNSFNIDIDGDLTPSHRPQLTRRHSNINPSISTNNTSNPAMQPIHVQNMPHNNCHCVPLPQSKQMTHIPQCNQTTNNAEYALREYQPTPICGLQDPLTSGVLTIGSLHSSNSNDTFCSQPSTTYHNSLYSNNSYPNHNQSQLPIAAPHMSRQIDDIQANKTSGNYHLQQSGYYQPINYTKQPQHQCSCYHNNNNNNNNNRVFNTHNNNNRAPLRYDANPVSNGPEALSLDTFLSALRSGINTAEMAVVIARMVWSICCSTNKRKISIQTLMNCNITNILTNAMQIHHHYPLVVNQCQIALNHLNRSMQSQQNGIRPPQTGSSRLYATNSSDMNQNHGKKFIHPMGINPNLNHINHVQSMQTPETRATVTSCQKLTVTGRETVATPTKTCTVNKQKKTSKKRRLQIPSLEPIKKRKKNEFVSLDASCDGGYKCKKCGKVYKYICNLRSHSKIHTPDAHVCEFCNKRFGRKANYEEHKRVHTGEQPFKCKICKRGFKQRYGWKDHMKIHKKT